MCLLLSQVRSTNREIQTEHSCREKIIARAFRLVTYSNTRQPRENDIYIVGSLLKYSVNLCSFRPLTLNTFHTDLFRFLAVGFKNSPIPVTAPQFLSRMLPWHFACYPFVPCLPPPSPVFFFLFVRVVINSDLDVFWNREKKRNRNISCDDGKKKKKNKNEGTNEKSRIFPRYQYKTDTQYLKILNFIAV